MDIGIGTPALDFADLKGPRRLPIIGNMHQLNPRRFHTILEQWCSRYGTPYRFSVGSRHVVVISDPSAIAEVLRRRPEDFRRADWIEPVFKEIGAHGVFSAEGDAWRRQRRLVTPALDPVHLKSYFPSLMRVTGRLQRRWLDVAALHRPIDLQADLMRFTVDVTAGLAFGVDVNTIESDRDQIQQHLNSVFTEINRRGGIPFPYWRYVRLPRDRALDRHLIAIHKAIATFIADARQRLSRDPDLRAHPENLIESMICARDEDGSAFSDADLAGNIFTMLLAGEDTTANTLAWLIYLGAREPYVWDRIAAEADATVGAAPGMTRLEQAAHLSFIDACISETMRLRPVAPVSALTARREVVLEGVRVPPGTEVITLMRIGAIAEENVPSPSRFLPDRWLTNDANRGSTKRWMFPFGGGPRYCPGRYLALLEIRMVMSMLSRNFERPEVRSESGAEPREIFNFTMMPSPLTMKLVPRTRSVAAGT